MKRGLLLLVSCVILLATSIPVLATNIVLNVVDGTQEGFNDPTPVAPVTGNAGTTLGEQRRNVFLAAAKFWEERLESSVEIRVDAEFNPLTCTPTGATLGFAGPLSVAYNFPNAPVPNQLYTIALANSLAGIDLSTDSDIASVFNSTLDSGSSTCLNGDGWDYRLGVSTGSTLEFFATAVHELAHGLGFLSLHSQDTGSLFLGMIDSFNVNLADQSIGLAWSSMTDAQRLASSTNTGNLVWFGDQVASESGVLVSGLQPAGVQMYAPDPLQPGSSVSHWDTALSPDELMEPIATANPISDLTTNAMYDMGWIEPVMQCNGFLVTVDLSNGDVPTSGPDVIMGTSGDDEINGLGGDDTICALAGNDTINAGNGNDWVDAGPGNDTVEGGNGSDEIYGDTGVDILNGGPNNDEIFGEADGDFINGNSGDDLLVGGAGVDQLRGGSGDDVINTGSGGNRGTGLVVTGGAGNDIITGGSGTDEIRGETGNDTILGGDASDSLFGGGGSDIVNGQDGDDILRGNGSKDTVLGGEGNDDMDGGDSDDILSGGNGNDMMRGATGNDEMSGGAGNDELFGGGGNDIINGNRGDDTLFGGGSNDTLNGGSDTDSCSGDGGTDSAVSCESETSIP